MNISEVKSILNDLKDVKDNWDGYNGVKPIESILTKSEIFLSGLTTIQLDKVTDIYPNPNGTISIEFYKDKDRRISLEIGESSSSYYFKKTKNDVEFNDDYVIDEVIITDINLL
jgi:hypothetical protein